MVRATTRIRLRTVLAPVLGAAVTVGWAGQAFAQVDETKPAPPLVADGWLSGVVFGGHIEFGATLNPADPNNGVNFGQLFTDKANQIVLNQFALSVERPVNPNSAFDLGFRAEGMYGLDSQFVHFMGVGDQGSTTRNSIDVVEANLDAHARILTARGVDLKLGLFPSPIGFETLDPGGDLFYSRSYIYNFGLPKKFAGALVTTHVNAALDLFLGYTTGANASFGRGGGYNDEQPHPLGGGALDLGRVTVRATGYAGPEDPEGSLPPGVDPHDRWRYTGDIVVGWKITDRLTSVTEMNYVRDDGYRATAGGVAEYLAYQLSPTLAAAFRAEVWRDGAGVFVAGFPGNLDYVDVEEGLPNHAYRGGPATYGEVTAGLNIKADRLLNLARAPADSPFGGVTVRPELRYDRILAGGAPFDGEPGTAKHQITAAVDVVIPLGFQRPGGGGAGTWVNAFESAEPAPDEPVSTAPARAKLAQDAPDGSTIITARMLPLRAAIDAATLEDLADVAPGLAVERSGAAPLALSLSMRGLGEAAPSVGQLSAVGVSLDGVQLGASLARLIDLFDLASLEVDRGPSGADGGDIALGGMITATRARPTRHWGVDLDYGFEQGFHANTEKLLFNMPVGETAGLALFVSHAQRGGYLTNIASGDPLYGRDELTSGSLQFDWSLTPRLEANAEVTLAHQDGQGVPLVLGDSLDARLFGAGLAATTPGLRFSANGSPYIPGVTLPLGPWQTANNGGDVSRLTAQIYSLRLAYDLGAARLTSTTSYLSEHDEIGQDADGGCATAGGVPVNCPVIANPFVGFLDTARPQRYADFSQALRFDDALASWAKVWAGLSFAHDDLHSTELATSAEPLTEIAASQSRDSRSVFAGARMSPLSRLSLDLGLRYLDESTRYAQAVDQTLAAFSGSRDTRSLLARAAVNYSVANGVLVHADYSTATRPGGLTAASTLSEAIAGQSNYAAGAADSAYGAERDATYEAGVKLTGLADQVAANVTGYLTEDRNHQAPEMVRTPGYGPAVNSYIVNLPKVRIEGAELDLDVRPKPLPGFSLTAEGAYEHARIVDGLVPASEVAVGPGAIAGAAGALADLTGTPLVLAPTFTLGARGDYRRSIGPGILDANVGYRWTDRYALATLGGQGDYQGAFGLLDVSLSYSRSFYRIIVSGRNLLNTSYVTYAAPALFVHGWGDPRTAVIELQAKF